MTTQSVYRENVRELIGRPGEMRERERSFAVPETLGAALATVAEGSEMTLRSRFESVYDGILASADVDTTMTAECSRCLAEFNAPFQVEFQELFAYTPTEADEYGVHGDHVDLEPPLRDAVVLALPFQPVCRPDCPGLDPESGELRDAEAAVSTDAIDPRWAALAEFQADHTRGSEEDSGSDKK